MLPLKPVEGHRPSPADTELAVAVVRNVAGIAGLQRDYAQLQLTTGNTLPFSLYEWQSVWCRHFLGRNEGIDDTPVFHVFRTADGSCVAIVPLIRTQRRLGGVSVASLGLLGADPALTEVRSALVRPGYEDRVAEALDDSLQRAQDWDWVQWSSAGGKFSAALGRVRSLRWQPAAPGYVLDLPATWEELRAGLKRNIRESLRHCYNSLQRDGHAFELRIASDTGAVRQALDRLFELHALRAATEDMVNHPNRFASATVRGFVYEVCDELAARDSVRIFQIEIAGRIVASRIGFLVHDSLYLYYSGFDPAWSRYSVMTTTVAEAVKYAITQGLKTVDLSPGTDVSKTRWGPREVAQLAAYEHSGRLRSRFMRHAYLKARSGEGLQGWLLQRLTAGRRTWN